MKIVFLNVSSIKQDLSSVDIIITHEKTNESAFTTSTFSYKSYCFLSFDGKVETFEYPIWLSGGVSEPNVFEFNLSIHLTKI